MGAGTVTFLVLWQLAVTAGLIGSCAFYFIRRKKKKEKAKDKNPFLDERALQQMNSVYQDENRAMTPGGNGYKYTSNISIVHTCKETVVEPLALEDISSSRPSTSPSARERPSTAISLRHIQGSIPPPKAASPLPPIIGACHSPLPPPIIPSPRIMEED